jgi:hypothetical protein
MNVQIRAPAPGTAPRRTGLLIALLLGGGAILALIVAVAGFAWWGYNLFEDQARDAVARNPVIERHVGEIRDFDFDLSATGDDPDPEVFVVRVGGSLASGTVTAKFVTVDAERERIANGTLVLDSGERYDLEPEEE